MEQRALAVIGKAGGSGASEEGWIVVVLRV